MKNARSVAMSFTDKSAVVTGAASAIGKDISLVYAREGAKVAVADLDLEAASATAKAIRAAGGQAMAVAIDVTNEQQATDGVIG
jgi:3-hydroxybutyrate dehydrogenase